MLKLFNKIKLFGVTPETDFNEQNRLEIFNGMLLTTIIICGIYGPIMIYNGVFWGFVQNMTLVACLGLCLWLNSINKSEISKHFTSFFACAYFLAFAYLYGERGQIISFIEIMPMLLAILYDSTIHFKKYLTVVFLTVAGCYYFYWYHAPLYDIPAIKYVGASSTFVSILIIFFLMNYFKSENKKHEEKIVEQSNQLKDAFEELNQQNEEISTQRDEIENQKLLVEEHQKEMIDSITYAKRIQDAILPPIDYIQSFIPNAFVLYKPKDIIAGDFYWMHTIEFANNSISQLADSNTNRLIDKSANQLIFIAAADCTGHGVPGAMVSVVCSNALNRAVKEFHLTQPGEILDKVRELVIETFEKSGEDIKDGMDISLMSIEYNFEVSNNPIVKWSGANNALYIVSHNGDEKLSEIKADKQPIGKSDHNKPFTTYHVPYEPGATFYLITDGYADQFGGPKGKKFKYKPLEEMLVDISNKPMLTQSEILNQKFLEWKGNLEQVDDVTILGVRI